MERVVYVEIFDKRGGVKERIRLDAFPATIGRAYTNSVLLLMISMCALSICALILMKKEIL